jgi:DNA-binding response OmpR family regulator
MRILVVEDEHLLGDAIVTALHETDRVIDLARDGARALELADQWKYDLVVLDWTIPPPTGIELMTNWRARSAVGRILMLSAWDGEQDRSLAMASGADAYLTKPFTLKDLRNHVGRLLDT